MTRVYMDRGSAGPMDIDRPEPLWTREQREKPSKPSPFGQVIEQHKVQKQQQQHRIQQPISPMKRLSINPSKVIKKSHSSNSSQQSTCDRRSIFSNPNLPHLLVGYVQLLFNMSLAIIILYLIGAFVHTVQRDLAIKASQHRDRSMSEIALCKKLYEENRCAPGSRVPAMESKCREWEVAISRDPLAVGGGRVLAETIADIVNGLVEPISMKSMLFVSLLCFGSIFLSNYAFALARHKYPQHDQPPTIQISTGSMDKGQHYKNVFNRRMISNGSDEDYT